MRKYNLTILHQLFNIHASMLLILFFFQLAQLIFISNYLKLRILCNILNEKILNTYIFYDVLFGREPLKSNSNQDKCIIYSKRMTSLFFVFNFDNCNIEFS